MAAASAVAAVILVLSVMLVQDVVATNPAIGTQVAFGDPDFAPVLSAPLSAIRVLWIDFHVPCYYLMRASTGGLGNDDLRLTACQGKSAGTMIGDTDNVEKGATSNPAPGGSLHAAYVDKNPDARPDAGDCYYLTTASSGLVATTNNSTTLRLTGCEGQSAGTAVVANDTDLVAHASSAVALPSATVNYFDADLDGALTPGDHAYLVPNGATAGSRIPFESLRILGATPYGSSVATGDAEQHAVGRLAGPNLVPSSSRIIEWDRGLAGNATDNCFYLDVDGDARISAHDVRLVDCLTGKNGTQVSGGDAAESGAPAVASGFRALVYADLDHNGGYGGGDCAYLTTATTGIAATTSNRNWTIRLLPCAHKGVGTLVGVHDQDYGDWANQASPLPAGSGFNFLDPNANGLLDWGEASYWVRGTPAQGGLVTLASIRLGDGSYSPGLPTSTTTASSTTSRSSTSSASHASSVVTTSSTRSSSAVTSESKESTVSYAHHDVWPTSPTVAHPLSTQRSPVNVPGAAVGAVVAAIATAALVALRRDP